MSRLALMIGCAAACCGTALAVSGHRGISRDTMLSGTFNESCVERAVQSVPGVAITHRIERGKPGSLSLAWAWSIVYSAETLLIDRSRPPNPRFELWAGEEEAQPKMAKVSHSFTQFLPSEPLSQSVFDNAFAVLTQVEAAVVEVCQIDLASNAITTCRNVDCGKMK